MQARRFRVRSGYLRQNYRANGPGGRCSKDFEGVDFNNLWQRRRFAPRPPSTKSNEYQSTIDADRRLARFPADHPAIPGRRRTGGSARIGGLGECSRTSDRTRRCGKPPVTCAPPIAPRHDTLARPATKHDAALLGAGDTGAKSLVNFGRRFLDREQSQVSRDEPSQLLGLRPDGELILLEAAGDLGVRWHDVECPVCTRGYD